MASQGYVSNWIDLLKGGDHAAAQPLWERYFQRLVGLARTKLPGSRRRAADEEDVALPRLRYASARELAEVDAGGGGSKLEELISIP
jgi:hypothetical protein